MLIEDIGCWPALPQRPRHALHELAVVVGLLDDLGRLEQDVLGDGEAEGLDAGVSLNGKQHRSARFLTGSTSGSHERLRRLP